SEIVAPTDSESVLMELGFALTVTLDCAPDKANVIVMGVVFPTVNTTVTGFSSNPCTFAVTSYVPTGNTLAERFPFEPVVTIRSNPVALCFSTTVAPGTTAPLGSFTVPSSAELPDSDCPNARSDRQVTTIATISNNLAITPKDFTFTPLQTNRLDRLVGHG